VALAQVAAVAARVAIPIVGMGGVRSGSDARDLMAVGATLVAVGTESFRDPRAGARVAEELKSLQMAKKRSTTLDGPEAQVEVERNSAAEPCEPQPRL
jgi:dihydroorotate dehydrogenase (NAD+) catalytic subunit